jgi:hypothetical protein
MNALNLHCALPHYKILANDLNSPHPFPKKIKIRGYLTFEVAE